MTDNLLFITKEDLLEIMQWLTQVEGFDVAYPGEG